MSVLSPLQQQNRNALQRLLDDKELRCLLWTIVAEECGVFLPKSAEVSARDVGLRLLDNLKYISIDKVHLAEKEYLAKLEEDRAWREREELNARNDFE